MSSAAVQHSNPPLHSSSKYQCYSQPQQGSPSSQRRPSRSGNEQLTPQQLIVDREDPTARRRAPEPQPAPNHSRSATAVGVPPMGSNLPREDSTVINRLVVADPQEAMAREQARMAEARPAPTGTDVTPITGLGLVGSEGVNDGGRGAGKSRQDHSQSKPRRETKFGEYILGQTLGEGEFGKVKMGWKKEGGVQVAIKLIRREVLGSNPSRLPKIYREISILRGLQHPNIVRLHEMVETERHIGIILEYASGGELFDYILNHRYLKDQSARRLFAQLVSGVGYLHKKGIVHRDLKLENLLLDRNKNIIITDFGFANTFDPHDELGDEIEYNLGNKDYVKKMGLETLRDDGHRRGDLMQTSCGSPCYAAPELVVSDSLYTGRKVDVWSCGVILYAMLAGYLPFDDDPANPEGDNINLLYKYIVSTPLTFPEYVTPHARDLLKRILVPDPRKRADLFEVARHSWLSEYAHVVGFITSSTTTSSDIANTTVPAEDPYEVPQLARSASVREPSKPHSVVAPVGGLTQKHGGIDQAEQAEKRGQRDAKRRTVQVEYVAPHTQTQRGESPSSGPSASSGARARQEGPVEVVPDSYSSSRSQRPSTGQTGPPLTRPGRDAQRSASDMPFSSTPITPSARPSTGGTMGSRLPSRGNSYGQPAAATVAATNVQGRFSQPKGKQYVISAPMPQEQVQPESIGRPSTQRLPSSYQQTAPVDGQPSHPQRPGAHKRSNTVGSIFRAGSLFGGKSHDGQKQKSYPPVSMSGSIPNEGDHRRSTESSRRPSFSFSRKNSEAPSRSENRQSRRFSLLPASFSMRSFGGSQREPPPGSSHSNENRRSGTQQSQRRGNVPRAQMAFGRGESPSPSQSTTASTLPISGNGDLDRRRTADTAPRGSNRVPSSAPPQQTHFPTSAPQYGHYDEGTGQYYGDAIGGPNPNAFYGGGGASGSDVSSQNGGGGTLGQQQQLAYRQQQQLQQQQYAQQGFDSSTEQVSEPSGGTGTGKRTMLQKNRRFADAYEDQRHAGSSGAAKRAMDWFRRRGKARAGEGR
ncbi:uncharacterized protein K452DRAFT_299811 [Aplosporella prunicola CBS 121167]|uniref:non-specific serine/threonine protein kinase n=1 Tax=Aplosporella prunicola CBS 121167 TaxID=1176127 RepID=A0A6A6BBG3_9PEZI|nr:uncharacterized protein K452DRAFT_299811 [Aplosporella prunicola CBS 121167]KAF2139821.1 hypothetical protein K452DRAFT_299811 [Aplosporella prunicola CBS 121167]